MWIKRGIAYAQNERHPILQDWSRAGYDSFLWLNALADDLRVLEGVRGLDAVLKDLRNTKLYKPTRHVLHSAALFARAGNVIERFYPQTSNALPDYEIVVDSKRVAVEAKILLRSDVEQRFGYYAEGFVKQLYSQVLTWDAVHPEVYVVVKDAHTLPSFEDIFSVIKAGIAQFNGKKLEFRSAQFNVFLSEPQRGFEAFLFCQVLCPRSPRENLRAESRGKDASKQLQSGLTANLPGIFHLEIDRHQDPQDIHDLFQKRFKQQQFRGIGGVILSRTNICYGPPVAMLVDALGIFQNPSAVRPVPVELSLRGINPLLDLSKLTAFDKPKIPAYWHGDARAKLPPNPPNGLQLDLAIPSALTPEMLT